MSHLHTMTDSDTRFVFDPITNKLTNTSSKKTLAQGSHEREIFSFELPRFIEGHDMSLCNSVEVHYTNTDTKTKEKSEDVYTAHDLTVEGDKVIFSWLIRDTATKYVGGLSFSFHLRCTEGDELLYDCPSASYDKITVIKTENTSAQAVGTASDLLASFKAEALEEVNKSLEDAGNAAERARESASSASESEQRALQSKTTAEEHKNAAQTAATQAGNSATSANESKESALTAKTEAQQAETNAKASEDAAKTSEDNAKASENNAASSEQITTQKAQEAASSAKAAENAAASAGTFVGSANTAANAAAKSASEAEGFANLAAETSGISANAIKGKAEGEIVRIDDVSTIEHTPSVIVRGKNFWNTDLAYPRNNMDYDSVNQIYTISGATNLTLFALPRPIPKGTKVTITATIIEGVVTSNGDSGLAFGGYHKGDGDSWQGYISIPSMTETDISGEEYTQTAITTEDVTHFHVFVYAPTATIHTPLKFKVMYEIGEKTAFEPTLDPTTVTVTKCGENILPTESMTVQGTGQYTFLRANAVTAPNGSYIFKCKYASQGTDTGKVCASIRSIEDPGTIIAQAVGSTRNGVMTVPFSITEGMSGFYVYLYSNVQALTLSTKCVFSRMRVAVARETEPKYEVYNSETVTPGADGSVEGLTSLSPTMTLYTNTPGVIIECEYNRDTSKVVAGISEDIRTLDNGLAAVVEDLGDIETALDSILAIQEGLLSDLSTAADEIIEIQETFIGGENE